MLILASATGLMAVLGFFVVKRLLHSDAYNCYHSDYHNHFNDMTEEDFHGVEFLSMR